MIKTRKQLNILNTLNFTIKVRDNGQKQNYEIDHELKNPWTIFIRTDNFDCDRAGRTLFEQRLLKDIVTNLSCAWSTNDGAWLAGTPTDAYSLVRCEL